MDFDTYFSLVPDAVLVHADERWIYANDDALELLGARREELIGRSVFDVVPPDARPFVEQRVRESYAVGTKLLGQRLVRLDGRTIDVEITGRPFDAAGRRAAMIVVRDVSERRSMEERFRATFEQAAVGMAHVGADGRWLRVNERLCAMLGYSREEMLGLTFQDLMHPDDLGDDIVAAEQLLRGETSQFIREKRYIHKNGDPVWAYVTISLVRTAAGEPDYFISVVEDIRERKNIEFELRDSEERFRNLIENGGELIVVIDETAVIRYVGGPLESMMGFTPQELFGQQAFAFLHVDDIPAAVALLQELVRDGGRTSATARARHAAGGWRVLDFTAVNLLANPAVQGIVLNARDVTERNAMRSELEALQRVESLGRVAASITHEFNNVLHGIGMITAAMAKKGVAPAMVDSIRRSVDRGRTMTGEILRYSRRIDLSRRLIDVGEWLGALTADLRPQLGDGVALRLALDEGLPRIDGDPEQLAQVVTNLVLNARDAVQGTGHIDVAARIPEHLPPSQGGTFVALVVRDDGPGIPPHVRERIFDPLFTTKQSGTGLGLAIVQQIVTRHGGTIAAESEPGQGAEFTVVLPARG